MKFNTGKNRQQVEIVSQCLDDTIGPENEVRLIDLFVESLPLDQMGFKADFIENLPADKAGGRPAYHPADLLKLLIYGYLNRVRSSRLLEAECHRNLEVIWLMRGLRPDHNTISNFRKDNPEAIRKVFRASVNLAKHFELIGGKLLAGDSTKLRAQNSKKNNFNIKKIDLHLEYIDQKLADYTRQLAESDGDHRGALQQHIEEQQSRRQRYENLKTQLAETGEVQISTSDPDSRQMITRNNITEVAYNVQSTVDAKHNLPIDYLVTNTNDSKAMGLMLERAVAVLGNSDFTALYDKGYHTGSELKTAQELGVEAMVAIPDISSASMAPDPAYNVSEFTYHADTHTYTCPQGHTLRTNGHWYKKDRNAPGRTKNPPIRVQHFKTPHCKTCPVLDLCTKNTRGRGRVIERSEYAAYVEKNKQNIERNQTLYRRRQAIVEHPFGIIKRQWGFYYISTKRGLDKASADVGMIFTAFNLRRIFNLTAPEKLKHFLREVLAPIFGFDKLLLDSKIAILPMLFFGLHLALYSKNHALNRFI